MYKLKESEIEIKNLSRFKKENEILSDSLDKLRNDRRNNNGSPIRGFGDIREFKESTSSNMNLFQTQSLKDSLSQLNQVIIIIN